MKARTYRVYEWPTGGSTQFGADTDEQALTYVASHYPSHGRTAMQLVEVTGSAWCEQKRNIPLSPTTRDGETTT